MKKSLCCLLLTLALLLSMGAAQADANRITGEIVEVASPGDVQVLWDTGAFEATFNDRQFMGRIEADGTLLLGNGKNALRLGALPDRALLDALLERLDKEPVFKSSIYSSLFTHAQSIELTANEVCGYLRTLLNLCPLLDPDGSLRHVAEAQPGGDIWATVTRYSAADQSQYPDALTLQLNVFSPVLPAVWIEYYRTDNNGSNFKIAVSNQPVTDWDETISALAETEPGDGSLGKLISGFTATYDDGSETWHYLEVTLFGFSRQYQLEADIYQDDTDAARWRAEIVINDEGAGSAVAKLALENEASSLTPAPALDGLEIVDGTDGLDEAEQQLLGVDGFSL